jgi:ABC-type nitrate/sulfonate/bicarbonate transport system ATPase subunit
MSAPVLELVGIAKRFGALTVLREVSLSVPPGAFVSLIGPGLLAPSAGRVLLDGRALTGPGAAGYVPQGDHLLPWRTLLENVMLGPQVRGAPRREALAEARALLGRFGLGGFEDAYPHELSGGMRQRAALLRAVMFERRLLILDEPLGALDALTRLSVQRWLAELVAACGASALLVTHDMREALLLSDTIYVLSRPPARVRLRLEVPLPRPRPPQALAELAGLEATLVDALLEPV